MNFFYLAASIGPATAQQTARSSLVCRSEQPTALSDRQQTLEKDHSPSPAQLN